MRAIQVSTLGGPEVLEWVERDDPRPGPAELVVNAEAAGVNFIDTYHRSGLYPVPLPFVPGSEGAGVVEAVGDGVSAFAVGDRVAWSGVPGSYATRVKVPERLAVVVPEGIELETAAAVMLQGMTAHFLATDAWPLQAGQRCLVQAGAGGVGLLLVQIAKRLGAEVFTTVGSEDKVALATLAGADHVINYRDTEFGAAVEETGGPRPLDVVYDGVGRSTFDRGLELLRPRGMMVTFGNASGPVDPVVPLALMRNGSLYLTRPTLADYIATRQELERRTGDLFAWITDGTLKVRIGERIPLADAAEAHRRLEARETSGKVLLVP
jgi:NADPH2:quinone reductase